MSVTRAIVCRSCPAGRDELARALDAALAGAGLRVAVEEIDCMSGCTRPSTVAVAGSGPCTARMAWDPTGTPASSKRPDASVTPTSPATVTRVPEWSVAPRSRTTPLTRPTWVGSSPASFPATPPSLSPPQGADSCTHTPSHRT